MNALNMNYFVVFQMENRLSSSLISYIFYTSDLH